MPSQVDIHSVIGQMQYVCVFMNCYQIAVFILTNDDEIPKFAKILPLKINYDARFIGFPVFIIFFLSLNFDVSLEKTFPSTYGPPTQRPVAQRELVSYNLNQ